MNAEQVVDKILSEAKAEADAVLSDAAGKAEAEDKRLVADLEAYSAQTAQKAGDAAEDKKRRMLAAARMDNSKAYLQAKVELLNDVFKKAADAINNLPEEQYQELMTAFLLKAIETGDEHVIVGRNDTRLNDKVIKNINRQLGPGYKGNLTLVAEKADISGGFLLRRGKLQINVSTDVLIDQVRETLEMQLARDLFGEESPAGNDNESEENEA
jgi:V/A-type H+-transporting ATPase subunit E